MRAHIAQFSLLSMAQLLHLLVVRPMAPTAVLALGTYWASFATMLGLRKLSPFPCDQYHTCIAAVSVPPSLPLSQFGALFISWLLQGESITACPPLCHATHSSLRPSMQH